MTTTERDPAETAAPADSHGLTMLQGAALTIGGVLGTGVITLPSLAARAAGPASLVSWVVLVILSVPLAATFGALGARFPDAGGVASYVRRAFGPRAGGVVGWCFYLAVPVGAPAASMMAGHYVAAAFGGGRVTVLGVSLALILGVGGMNARGVRLSGKVQLVFSAVLAVLILVTVAVAAPHARPSAIGPFAPHGVAGVVTACGLLVWAFAGWEAVAPVAAEYRFPRRDVPLATGIAVAVVGVLYLALAVTTVLVLGPAAASSNAPLSDLMSLAVGDGARVATAGVAVLLSIGAMNAYFAGSAKLGSALGRDGALPSWFGAGSGVGEVPRRSLAVVTGLACVTLLITALTGLELEVWLLLATSAFGVVYVLGTAAAVRLLPPGWSRRGAVVALAASIGLAISIGIPMLWSLAVAAAALTYQRLAKRQRA